MGSVQAVTRVSAEAAPPTSSEEGPGQHDPEEPGTCESDEDERHYGEDRYQGDGHCEHKCRLDPQGGLVAAIVTSSREIGDDGVELAVSTGGEDDAEPVLELLGLQTPLGARVTKPLGDLLAVAVGRS